jgi:drug/metabolite transporter (DMT)-like permease
MASGALVLTIALPFFDTAMFVWPNTHDLLLLLLLSIACTLLPFVLSLVALRHITAFGAQLAINLEPIYAILLAIPLLGEQRQLDEQFYLGVAIIMAVVFIHPLLSRADAKN